MASKFITFEPRGVIALDLEIARTVDEAGGWDRTGAMGYSVCCVHDLERGRSRFYDLGQHEALLECLDRAETIITHNGWRFDLPVIYGLDRPDWGASEFPGRRGGPKDETLADRSCDMLWNIWKARGYDPDAKTGTRPVGFALDEIGEATLGVKKCGNGAQAPQLYKEGRWAELLTYCEHDTLLTADIYRFALRHGFLVGRGEKNLVRFNFKK